MQIEGNVVTSAIVILMMLTVAKGYWHLIAVERGSWGYYLVRAVMFGSFAAILRTGYWDLLPFLLGERWEAVRIMLGGPSISTVFNAPLILSAYYILCSRLVLIPEEDRHRWRWWNAWLHPTGLRLRLRSKPFR